MKRLASIVVGSVIATLAAIPTLAGYIPPNVTEEQISESQYISLSDASFGLWSSRLTSYRSAKDVVLCVELAGDCALEQSQARQINANLNFEICSQADQIDCIKKFEVNSENVLLQVLPGSMTVGSPDHFLPTGAGPVLAQVNGQGFVVSIRGEYQFDQKKGIFIPRALDVDVVPVRAVPGDFSDVSIRQIISGAARTVSENGESPGCYYSTVSTCYMADRAALAGLEIDLELQLSKQWSGFFKGRLSSPVLEVSKSNSVQIVSVRAMAAETHRVFFKVDMAKYGTAQQAAICTGMNWCEGLTASSRGVRTYLSSAPASMAIIQNFSDHHFDKAAQQELEWSFGVGRYAGSNCLAPNQGLLGLVTSNAPVFQASPPTYQAGYLSYEIAGLHYNSDGKTLNIGEYDLQIRSDVARCLYGFNKAPVSATVQVLSDKGQELIATTLVSESDGWVRITAKNFTFSKKKVRVKFAQPVQAVIPAFTSSTIKLSKTQDKALTTALKSKVKGLVITCTGLFSSEAQRAITLKRAKAVCDAAKRIRPTSTVQALVAPASGSGKKSGVVILRSY